MGNGKDTCNDRRVPRQATGKTPVRNLRIADDVWLPALAKAEAEGRTLTSVIDAFVRDYSESALGEAYDFTLANWPAAGAWGKEHAGSLAALHKSLMEAGIVLPGEWLTVAAWLAVDRHPGDPGQQKRILAGHVVGRYTSVPDGAVKAGFRDGRQIAETVLAILGNYLPLSGD